MPLMTLGEIAKKLHLPAHRVKYAIETYQIEPVCRIGIVRVWDEAGLEHIRSAVKRIAGRSCCV